MHFHIHALTSAVGYSISQEICTRFCFAVLCCGYTLTDFPISIRLTSLALWQSNDCPSASKATLMNIEKYFMWIHYERLHNHNKAQHNKTVCIFLGIYCNWIAVEVWPYSSLAYFPDTKYTLFLTNKIKYKIIICIFHQYSSWIYHFPHFSTIKYILYIRIQFETVVDFRPRMHSLTLMAHFVQRSPP